MFRKTNLLSILLVCMISVSCKNENSSSENDENVEVIENNSVVPNVNEGSETISSDIATDGKYPAMTFAETNFDFGEIVQGQKVEHTFTFKNTGEADLILSDAKSSCGCTVPEYPKNTPIKPGASGNMTVTFDSEGKLGPTSKTITVMCNTESGNEVLEITTNINPKK